MTKDTAPFVISPRFKRVVCIQEVNTPPSSLFDTTVQYESSELPEWFAGLQSIVEDETFTSMIIYLGKKVQYRISVKAPLTIDLTGESGNVYALGSLAEKALYDAGLRDQATELMKRFKAMTTPIDRDDTTYEDVKTLVEEYCSVTWLNGRESGE
jgi:hypothetical protein